jgi:hypothetical protein
MSQDFTDEPRLEQRQTRYETETTRDYLSHHVPYITSSAQSLFAPSVLNHAHRQHTLTDHHKLLHEWTDAIQQEPTTNLNVFLTVSGDMYIC